MVYFSQLKGKPVYDSEGKSIGSLADMAFNDGEKYAESFIEYSAESIESVVNWIATRYKI